MQHTSLFEDVKDLDQDTLEICIVGAGPSGLAALSKLIEIAKNNSKKTYRIHLIEKRDLEHLNRRQKVIVLPGKPVPHAQNVRWDDFCKDLFDPNHEWSLDNQDKLLDANNTSDADLNKKQTFIRKLLQQPEDESKQIFRNFSLKDLQAALLEYIAEFIQFDTIDEDNLSEKNIKIILHQNTKIKDIDLKSNSILLTDSENPIHFDHLLLAEGQKREVTKLINQKIESDGYNIKPFSYAAFSRQPERYNCAVRLRIKSLDELGDYKNYQDFIHDKQMGQKEAYLDGLQRLKDLGLKSDQKRAMPDSVVDANAAFYKPIEGKIPRIFVASEIPEEIYNIRDEDVKREKIIDWAKQVASIKFQLPSEYFDFDDKGENKEAKLNAVTFINDLTYVDNPIRRLESGGYITMIGDCAMSPLYTAGFSSSLALNQALVSAECLNDANNANQFEPLRRLYFLHKEAIKSSLSRVEAKKRNLSFFHKNNDALSKVLFLLIEKNDINDLPRIHELINNGADPYFQANDKKYAMLLAISNNNLAFVNELLTYADPNRKINGITPLIMAIKTGDLAIITALLRQGADSNKIIDNTCPLSMALVDNNDELIKLLLNYGANLSLAIDLIKINYETLFSFEIDELKNDDNNVEIKQFQSLFNLSFNFQASPISTEDRLIHDFYDEFTNTNKFKSFLQKEYMANAGLCMLYTLLALKKRNKDKTNNEEEVARSSILLNRYEDELKLSPEQRISRYNLYYDLYKSWLESSYESINKDEKIDKNLLLTFSLLFEENKEMINELNQYTHHEAINHFVDAMINKHFYQNDDTFVDKLELSCSLDFIPAMIEMGKYYVKTNKIDKARDYFLQAAAKGSAFALIELAALTAKYPIGNLDLFNTTIFLDKGTAYSTGYFQAFHEDTYDRLEQYKLQLEEQIKSNDALVATNAMLDLAMAAEYDRVRTYEMSKSPESKYVIQKLQELSQQIIGTSIIHAQYEKLMAMKFIILNAIKSLNPAFFSPTFSHAMFQIDQKLQEAIPATFEEEIQSRYSHLQNLSEKPVLTLNKP